MLLAFDVDADTRRAMLMARGAAQETLQQYESLVMRNTILQPSMTLVHPKNCFVRSLVYLFVEVVSCTTPELTGKQARKRTLAQNMPTDGGKTTQPNGRFFPADSYVASKKYRCRPRPLWRSHNSNLYWAVTFGKQKTTHRR